MTLASRLQQFFRFGVVGTIGAVVDFGSYGIMTRLLGLDTVFCVGLFGAPSVRLDLASLPLCSAPRYPIVAANMVSVLLAITSNFLLNKFWTFRDRRTQNIAAQGASYLVMSIITWVLNQVLTGFFASRVTLLTTLFGSSVDVAAKVLAILIILFLNFAGSTLIFRRQKTPAVGY